MSSLTYHRFEMQNYLKLDGSDSYGAQTLFRYRVRMASYGDNFKGSHSPIMCPLCGVHIDSQINSFEKWQEIQKKVKAHGKYQDIFSSNVTNKLVETLKQIDEVREQMMQV